MTIFTNHEATMKISLLSPYHGGSHRQWAEGYQKYSGHQVALITLPGRFWKWRMHGGAVSLAQRYLAPERPPQGQPDAILATDMLDLTTFLALTRTETAAIATFLYMHENQLTYPLPGDGRSGPMRRQKGERDLHYAFINYASMLAADAIFFNSQYHQNAWFAALPGLLKHFPDHNQLENVAALRAKSRVMAVGVDFSSLERASGGVDRSSEVDQAPLIIWNQRWEYDKNPDAFFRVLYTIAAEGIPFRLALCGENFRRQPAEFEKAQERLASHIIHAGYAEPEKYRTLLWEAAVTISTAAHEFFGVSILEAIYCRTFPILPHALSYPELIPEQYHGRCLYVNEGGLQQRLRWALNRPAEAAAVAAQLAEAVAVYDWSHMAPYYDQQLATAAIASSPAHAKIPN
jgi:glycosyltransferase involved in cell wall biosynthesis